jgi:hypothetical protein
MIADFIGGPWHLTSRHIPAGIAADPPSQIHAQTSDPISWNVTLPADFVFTPKKSTYQLVIKTPTFCVYVDALAKAAWKDQTMDISDPVRYFFAYDFRFQEEVKGWTHHNPDLAAASVEGVRGMLAIQRFRKRKT